MKLPSVARIQLRSTVRIHELPKQRRNVRAPVLSPNHFDNGSGMKNMKAGNFEAADALILYGWTLYIA